jgi:hypothetical protein
VRREEEEEKERSGTSANQRESCRERVKPHATYCCEGGRAKVRRGESLVKNVVESLRRV